MECSDRSRGLRSPTYFESAAVLKIVYLGLGANLGNREETIERALRELSGPGLRLLRRSSFYETEPMGLREQPWFLNIVAEFETSLFPRQLLQRTRRVERKLGRVRTVVNGPRTIDIDILLFGDVVMQTNELEIPHPRFRERRFVLEPLAQLNPGLRDPLTGSSVKDLLAKTKDQAAIAVPEESLSCSPAKPG